MLGVDPTDTRVESFAREYYTNHYVYNLVNLLEQLYAEREWMREELKWLCEVTMGEIEVGQEVAGYRAWNVFKRLREGGRCPST